MFCTIQGRTYHEVVKVAKRACQIIRKTIKLYPSMVHSQKELVSLWDDKQVFPDADSDDGAPPTSERVSHFLRNSYLDMNNLLAAVQEDDTSLIEIGRYRPLHRNSAASEKPGEALRQRGRGGRLQSADGT